MDPQTFNRNRLVELDELLELEYEKRHEFEKEITLADGPTQKIALRQRIKHELIPRLRKLEQEYAKQLVAGSEQLVVPEGEAEALVVSLISAVAHTRANPPSNAPQEMLTLLEETRKQLAEPGKTAAAKLKITLPIVPLLASYEMELDTEKFVTQVWQRTREFFKHLISRPK
ncbi:MAG TPA: hypothetical protein VJT15_14525 [Pyrinomonadaceae bacterium]|nr:hypothetical protein [Pyrinomonadaceae bacterium]